MEPHDDEVQLSEDDRRFLLEKLGGSMAFIRALDDVDTPPPESASDATHAVQHAPPTDGDRYVFEQELASGGSGRILLVLDNAIRRRVAMKVLRDDAASERARRRFLEEAQATGQLEHPNIPPVYDVGEHAEHGVYFTLRLVRGRTLREILRDLAVGRLEALKHYTLTRLVQILQQVAMGVHYAHVRGVIHRDLKPENVMVGDFGEVQVLDWGVAKVTQRRPDSSKLEAPIRLSRGASEAATQDGAVSGTLSYMAPEQARGWVEEIDPRTDVFGLGAVLYEILTFHPPYEGRNFEEVLARAGARELVSPRIRSPQASIPPSLETICMKALSASKDERHADAMAFHEDLQVFLDGTLEGERRQREAAQHVQKGRDMAREHRRLTEAAGQLRADARKKLEAFAPHDPVEAKAAAWALLDQAAKKDEERSQIFGEATALLQSAIHIDEANAAAKEALADLFWQRFEEAERARDAPEMAIYRGLAARHDQGKLAVLLEDKGVLTVVTSPSGAAVYLQRIIERGWRLVAEEEQPRGTTPLKLELSSGDYLLVLRKEGCRDAALPVQVRRCEKQLARVNLYADAEIGEGFIQIPQGECAVGGDSAAPGSLPAGRRYIGDVFVAELPVTFREYCAFLDEIKAAGDPELERWMPRTEREGSCVRAGASGLFEPAPEALDIDPATLGLHAGPDFFWRLPILAVSWHAAERYTRWLSAKQGRKVRLLRDAEWEKAARGVAGWTHPWGDRFDWSFAKGGLSRPGRAQPEPVGAFPADRSIYGVRDLAGTIREWCQDWFLEGQYRLTRGGAWSGIHEGSFRAAHRLGTKPDNQSSVIGFRVAAEPKRLQIGARGIQ